MTYNRNKQYKKITEDWKFIRRHNDVTRGLSKSARHILFSVLYQIAKYGYAVLTHEELSEITDTKNHQNCNLVKQLGFVLDFTFERSIIVNEKKYRDCYIFTKNENTDKILENPEEYFANLLGKYSQITAKKFSDNCEKILRSHDPLYIYNKKEIKNDNHDYQHNQFQNSKNFSTENVETEGAKIDNPEIVEKSQSRLAKEECKAILEAKKQAIESLETPKTSKETKEITSYKQKPKTIETVGKDGNTYQSPYLRDFRFTDRMIQTAISRSNKKHYMPERVWIIIRNILEKKPNKTVYGGRQGAINYLVKAIDGENDYEYEYKYPPTQEEQALSMAEIQQQNQLKLEAEIAKGGIEWT